MKLLALKTATQLKLDTAVELSVADLAMTDRNTSPSNLKKKNATANVELKQVDDLVKTLKSLNDIK